MSAERSKPRKGCQYELQLCAMAFQFYSRLPVRLPLPFAEADLSTCTRYFPAVGLVVGLLSGLSFLLVLEILGTQQAFSAAVVATACSALLTGAFHEDGLADMVDGLGGGQTVSQRLTIMKDSRIGTYGALALMLSILLKVSLISALAPLSAAQVLAIFIAAAVVSRCNAALLIGLMPYAREDASSKVRPVAHNLSTLNRNSLLVAGLGCLVLSAMYLEAFGAALLGAATLAALLLLFRQALSTRLGGYTGDCLGGLQQLSELLILFVFAGQL